MTETLFKESLILPDKVLCIEPEETEEVRNGVVIPKQIQKTPTKRGIITMVGAKVETAKEGMTALYTPLSATRFLVGDQEYAILPETSILFLYREKSE